MSFNTGLQKEIWLKHIEVQERILQLNSTPIAVETESIQVVGQRLRLRVKQTDELDTQLNNVMHFFHISSEAIDEVNETLSCDSQLVVDSSALIKMAEDCQKHYIQLSTNPIVDGVIRSQKSSFAKCVNALIANNESYSVDSNQRLQVSVEALRKLDNDDSFPKEILPPNASGIFGITPTPVYFLRKWLSLDCTHSLMYKKIKNNGLEVFVLRRSISIRDNYLNDAASKKLFEIWGLKLLSYDVEFKVDEEILSIYDFDSSLYAFPKPKNGVFTYHFDTKTQSELDSMFIIRGKWQIDLLNNIYKMEFGEKTYSFHVIFNYSYNNKSYNLFLDNIDYSEFFQELKDKIDDDNISISEIKQSIGVDFDWRVVTPNDLKIELNNKYDDLEISVHQDHRCNIKISDKDANWDKVETFLKDNYKTLKTFMSSKDGAMHFFQEYRSLEQLSQFKISLSASLHQLSEMGCECEIHPINAGEKKYLLRIDHNKIAENKENIAKSLRGSEFTSEGHSIGKLIKVTFPELQFDLSSASDTFSNEEIHNINRITPNLEGDIEKINRLKNAFDTITSGKCAKNPNLSSFIFDSTKAIPTADIDCYTNESSSFYQDIKNNLLNKHINPSQLDAIIKCLKASDISLIQGPPGTGKSTAIAELIWQHIRLNPHERILLTSETNLAVDNAIDRTVNGIHNLVKPIRFGSDDRLAVEGKQFSISAMEQWVASGKNEYVVETEEDTDESEPITKSGKIILVNWLENIKKRIDYERMDPQIASMWENYLTSPNIEFRKIVYNQYKSNCNVVGATCSSIGEKNQKNTPTKFFMNYCTIFGEVVPRKIRKKTDYDNSEIEIEIPTYKSKDGISFTTVIQDESSKATPAELALPLIYGKKNIVIGDHRQLPPMLDKEEFINTLDYLMNKSRSELESNQLKKLKLYVIKNFREMEISHFQRIFETIDDSLKGEFTLQYRMHPDINDVIKQFYEKDKGLECGLTNPIDLGVNDTDLSNPFSRYHGIYIDDFICGESLTQNNHVLWIDVNSPEMIEGTSRINEGEVAVIKHILGKFSTSESFKQYCDFWTNEEDKEVGIISFYSKQRRRIREMCKSYVDLPLKIDVVDRFQGMERNIIIVSMVRSNTIVSDSHQEPDFSAYPLGYPEQTDLGFAQSPNRLNVALSRAKRLLIIIGNSALFRQKEIYDNVYNIIDSNPNGKIIKCNPNEII